MSHRHLLAARALALALLVILVVGGVSASAATTSTSSFSGTVSATGTSTRSHTFTAPAGADVSAKLGWGNSSANLYLTVYAPNGTVAGANHTTARPKTVSFTASASGTYTAVVRAKSGHSSYTLAVAITPNDPPTAVADAVSTVQGSAVVVHPLANDADADGDTLTLQSAAAPADGTATVSGDSVSYTPTAGYSGPDAFAYTVCDSRTPQMCSSAAVSVTVTPAITLSPNALRWAPPVLSNPITITLPATGDVQLNLDNTRDYRIVYPDVRRVGELHLIGGRNIVIIGGASTIAPHTGIGVRNIQLSDKAGVMDGRVIHIEGLSIDASGGGQADGIGIATPSAIVQIENVRITGLLGHLSETHADVVQTWGGMKALRMYNVTGSSHYNDLYFRRENSPLGPPQGPITLDHVNMFGYVNPTGWDVASTIRSAAIGTQPADTDCNAKNQCGPANPDSPVNCQMDSTVTLNSFYGEPPTGKLQRFMWPSDYMSSSGCPSLLSADGQSASWPALAGQVSGAMLLGPPPGGDFAPADSVGLGYISPGYQTP